MEPHAEALGGLPALDHLYHSVQTGSDAHYLRRQFAETGSAEGMVDAAIRRFRTGSIDV